MILFALVVFLQNCNGFNAVYDDDYVTLAIETGNEKAASHILTTVLVIGKPEKRYRMLIDFSLNEILMKSCLHLRSYTFDVSSNDTSDIVTFSSDSLLDPVTRGVERFPITERCSQEEFPVVECLQSDSCDGVLGLGPESPVWVKWSTATITRNALHLGYNNPRRLVPKDEKLQCDDNSYLCSFNAVFAGRRVTVDFNAKDSFTRIPADIYKRYTEERNLYGFTNGQKRSALQLSVARERARIAGSTVELDPSQGESGAKSRILFAERLENERQLALQYSSYYRATHEITDRAAWPPLVLLPLLEQTSSTSNIIVLDHDIIVYSPLYSGSYGKRSRVASSVPFAEYSNTLMTLMLRAHENESLTDHVSLGNNFFLRYNVRRDYVNNTIEIVEKFQTENLANVEVVGGLYLFVYFIFSMFRMMSYSTTLSVTLNRRCPSCGEANDPYSRHKLPTTLISILAVTFDVLMLLISSWFLLQVESLLADSVVPGAAAFSTWSWILFVPNAIVILAMVISAPGHKSPSDGTFCWRTFRITITYAACSEQIALLGLLWMTIILHSDTLGTTLSVFVAAAMLFSAAHHISHVFLFEQAFGTHLLTYIRLHPATKRAFPTLRANAVWLLFVLLVLFILNIVLAHTIMLSYIVLPVLNSSVMSMVIYGIAVLLAFHLLEVYEKLAISNSGFKNTYY
jgi:hypothetical protein